MSKIIFETEDFNLIPSPGLNEFILGIDIDGMPKLKRANDTILLGVNESAIISYHSVTYTQFLNLINSSGLIKGSVYLINNFSTRHYIQFTDSNGNGTGGNEAINTGSIEPLVLVATSNNTYNPEVKSLLYPNDFIIWKHILADRDRDYVGDGSSRGCITYRRSDKGNARDYDFRQVKFRRWKDNAGKYTIIRKVDAPAPLDYVDMVSFVDGYDLRGIEIGSFPSTYFMDNVVITSTMSLVENFKVVKGVNTNIIGATISHSKIDYLQDSLINGYFQNNTIGTIDSSTFSNTFNYNKIDMIIESQFNQASHNNISLIESVVTTILENNTGVTFSNLNLSNVKNNQISYLDSQSGGTNIIGNKIDTYTNNILTGDVNYNTIHIFQNNTGSGNITYNQGLEWIGNTFNNQVNGNSINYLTNNATMSSISDNFIANMVSNFGGTYSGNNGLEFSGNTCSLVVDNQLQYFTNNNGLSAQHNIGYLFDGNNGITASFISDNMVSEVSGNTILENGLIHNNQGTSIVSNTNYSIVSNTVTEILNNITWEINHNIGNLIEDNTSANGDINFNNVLEISSNASFIDITNNQGNIITGNNGSTVSSNQVTNIMNNIVDIIQSNIAVNINTNTISNIIKNQATDITNNNGNFSSVIENNIVSFITTNTQYDIISNNVGSTITNNSVDVIEGNKVTNIDNNINWDFISENSGVIIDSNIINSLIGSTTIWGNNLNEINNNQDIESISYNNGIQLNSNNFINELLHNNVSLINNNFNLNLVEKNNGNNLIGVTGSTIAAGPYSGSIANSPIVTFTSQDYTPFFNPSDVVVITGATAGTFSVISATFTSGNTYLTVNQTLNGIGSVDVTKVADKLYQLKDINSINLKWINLYNSIERHTMLDSIEYKSLTPSVPMRFGTYSTTSRYLIDLDGHYEERANSTGLTWSGPIA